MPEMPEKTQATVRPLTRMNEARCAQCPPERLCAWDCIQGASPMDMIIGAALEQSDNWALHAPDASHETVSRALWEVYNG